MNDDQILQELLSKGTTLYNKGDYKGAIGTWREVLHLDPSCRRAQEGIQMATLLLEDHEPQAAGPAPTPQVSETGASTAAAASGPESIKERIDAGIKNVKALLADRRFSEALQGARSLVPIDPESEQVQLLIEEAQQAFEAAPFIDEYMVLARELLAQDRCAEAEAQCRKVFVLDQDNPEARALMGEIEKRSEQSRGQEPVSSAATVKMNLDDILEQAAPEELEKDPGLKPPEAADPGMPDLPDLDALPDVPSLPAEPGANPATEGKEPEIVDPSATASSAGDLASQPEELHMDGSDSAEAGIPEFPPLSEPAPVAEAGAEATRDTPAGDDPAAWETELAELNLEAGQRDILGREATGSELPKTEESGSDIDLMSLLGDDIGDGSDSPVAEVETAEGLGGVEAIPLAPRGRQGAEPGQTKAGADSRGVGDVATIMPPAATARTRSPEEPAGSKSVKSEERSGSENIGSAPPDAPSPIPKYFALLGLTILIAGAAGWFFLQPGGTGGAGAPSQATSPPAELSVPPAAEGGPIPTPIGGSGRQNAPRAQDAAVGGVGMVAESVAEPTTGLAPEQTVPEIPNALTAEDRQRLFESHLEKGRHLMAKGDWRGARDEANAAVQIDPLNGTARELAGAAQAELDKEQELLKMFSEVQALFEEKDYQSALWRLYRLPREPVFGDIDLYIRNAWYNWGVTLLKAGNVTDALQKLSEALATDPDDQEAMRLNDFAESYAARARDRSYFAFTDDLPIRRIDQK